MNVPEILPLLKDYYPNHRSGGSLHIVLEDGNVDNKHVEYCKQYAIERGDADGARIADILLTMTKTQRRKAAYLWFHLDD